VPCQRFVDRLGSAVLEDKRCDWNWHSNLVIVALGTLVARCNSGVIRGLFLISGSATAPRKRFALVSDVWSKNGR
jgi:hypothetical protein